MQVVPGAHGAPRALDASGGLLAIAASPALAETADRLAGSNPVRLPAAEAPGKGKRRKKRKRLDLDSREAERLTNKLFRVVCSSRWGWDLKSRIVEGELAYKEDQAKELKRVGAYPPGGDKTRMERCCCCGRWGPPARSVRDEWVERLPGGQVRRRHDDWRPLCDDCHYADMPLLEMVSVPSSPGSTRRIPDGEIPAHLEAGGFYVNTKRRRFLDDKGRLREIISDEDGTVHDLVDVENRPPEGSPPAPASAENEAA